MRKPGSRFTRARIVSLKSRVKAIVVTFLPLDGGESGGKFRTNRSELDHGQSGDSLEIAEVQRRRVPRVLVAPSWVFHTRVWRVGILTLSSILSFHTSSCLAPQQTVRTMHALSRSKQTTYSNHLTNSTDML